MFVPPPGPPSPPLSLVLPQLFCADQVERDRAEYRRRMGYYDDMMRRTLVVATVTIGAMLALIAVVAAL